MRHFMTAALTSLTLAGSALAQDMTRVHGGDTYSAGETVTETLSATGDVFAAGSVVTTSGSAKFRVCGEPVCGTGAVSRDL